LESLEDRLLLDGDGVISGADVHLTLSFAPDGTQLAGQSSGLAARFDTIAPRSDWQDAILRAFQTWAVETNADFGVVPDGGQAFGSPGSSQRDPRFGDVRIGGIEMSPQVGAVSVPVDGVVTGTWLGDVVFNTTYPYQTLEDIFAVALHEAGNVFGLLDNSDPNSPLFSGGLPTGLPPTPSDLAALQALHGSRMPDLNELPDEGSGAARDNDSIANATRVKLVEFGGQVEGTGPSIVYGDLTTASDRDFYEIRTPGDYAGSVTVQIRSAGISLLAPRVVLLDSNQQVIAQATSSATRGDLIVLEVPAAGADEKFTLEVSAAAPGLMGIGGYSLVATFDAINQVDQGEIDALAGGQFRFLAQEEFEEFFDLDSENLFAVDLGANDSQATATELKTSLGFVDATRYEVVGSIDTAADVDFYDIKSPKPGVALDVMTIFIRSLDRGGLVPSVRVLHGNEPPSPVTILANGGGELIVQLEGILPDNNYHLKVEAADAAGPFNTGNYQLVVAFGDSATVLDPLSTGVVGNQTSQTTHTLYVGQPQLMHLALEVAPANVTTPTAIVATLKDAAGQTVHQLAAHPGETRSREAVLLQAGTYTVEIVPWTLDGSPSPELAYTLSGKSLSDPFVADPADPTSNPFACTEPGLEGLFCYPGGFVSPDPFLWDAFIGSTNIPPDALPLPALIQSLLGDWWSWVWSTAGVNGPPLAQADASHVQELGALAAASTFVGPSGSLLDNDLDPEGGAVVAIKKSDPQFGTLTLDPNGTFVYTPQAGFTGRDTFSYAAFDFVQESAVATVSIIVGISADFDADGDVDGTDFLAWQRGAGLSTNALLPDGDTNFDGRVDANDQAIWESTWGTTTNIVASGMATAQHVLPTVLSPLRAPFAPVVRMRIGEPMVPDMQPLSNTAAPPPVTSNVEVPAVELAARDRLFAGYQPVRRESLQDLAPELVVSKRIMEETLRRRGA
jgi:hypothetical protein